MKENTDNDLAALLLKCRAERGISIANAAKALRLSDSGLSKIERRISTPQRATRVRIVAFLNKHGYYPKSEAA